MGHLFEPPLVTEAEPVGSMPLRLSFQPMILEAAVRAAELGAAEVGDAPGSYWPRNDTPTLPVLKPWAWPPTIALVTPPERPSQMRPKRSMTKLYPRSHQRFVPVWYVYIDAIMAGTSDAA